MTANAQGLTPQMFFARRVEGALMVDAQRATGIAYSTIHRIAQGNSASSKALTALARWSLTCPAARDAGIFISLDAVVAEDVEADGDGIVVDRGEEFDQTGTGG